jgi:hypothetical protein
MTELEKAIGGPATDEARYSYKKLYAQHAAAVDKIDKDTARLTGDEVVNSYPIDVSQATGLPPTEKQLGKVATDYTSALIDTPFGKKVLALDNVPIKDEKEARQWADDNGYKATNKAESGIVRGGNAVKDNILTLLDGVKDFLPDEAGGIMAQGQRVLNKAEAAIGIGKYNDRLKALKMSIDASFGVSKMLAAGAGGGSSGMRASTELLQLSAYVNSAQAASTLQQARTQGLKLNELVNNVLRAQLGKDQVPAQNSDPFAEQIKALTPLRSDRRPNPNAPNGSATFTDSKGVRVTLTDPAAIARARAAKTPEVK